MGETLKFVANIDTQIDHLFFAFSNKSGWREWFCDHCEGRFDKLGYIALFFPNKQLVNLRLEKMEKNKFIELTWIDMKTLVPSEIRVDFNQVGEKIEITILHKNIPSQGLSFIEKLWKKGIDNLKSVTESGIDLRVAQRPMMGVFIDGLITAEIAAKKNFATDYGLLIKGVMKGFGAEVVGMQKRDVVINIDGVKIVDYGSVDSVISKKTGGDIVDLTYLRGLEEITTQVTLGYQVLTEVPSTSIELSEKLNTLYKWPNAKLDDILDGISEAQSEYRPAQKEWSIIDTISHLIITDRELLGWASSLVTGNEAMVYSSHLPARIKSLGSAYPGINNLRVTLSQAQQETVSFISDLPTEFVARKASYNRMGRTLIDETTHHYTEHINQIQSNLELASNVN